MADEDPSASNPAADSSIPKKETVRITLPPKPEETPMVKRETVRINAPGMTTPKKETTSIGAATPLPSATGSTLPPPSSTRPLVPPPSAPRPPSAPSLPGMGARPGMPPTAPRPGLPPTGAPKPAAGTPVAPASTGAGGTQPVTIKAAPKKETARIQVAPTSKLPPQATVRLSQPASQLAAGPAPAMRTAAPAAAEDAEPDKIMMALSWGAVAFSLIAAGLSCWVWMS